MSEHADTLMNYLRSAGADPVGIERGGKHPRIVFTYAGQSQFYVIPATLSDRRRGTRNALSDLRRMLDLAPAVKRVGKRRASRSKPAVPALHLVSSGASLSDWRPSLLTHPATDLSRLAGLAWLGWWRQLMCDVGGESRL